MGKKFHSRKPFYTDDLDFTTNAPSYYEALARFIKALKILTKRMDDVEQRFKDLILEWLEDGTLGDLLEQILLEDYAKKEWVLNLLEEYAKIEWVMEQLENISLDDYAKKEWVNEQINELKQMLNDLSDNLMIIINGLIEKVENNGFYNEVEQGGGRAYSTSYKWALIPHKDEDGNLIKLKRGFPKDEPNGGISQTARQFSADKHATMVVNASTFSSSTELRGRQIYNGKNIKGLENDISSNRWTLTIDDDNTLNSYPPSVTVNDLLEMGVKNSLVGFYPIYMNGEVRTDLWDTTATDEHPRTTIWQLTNKDIVIFSTDGRRPNNVGMTLQEVYNTMRDLFGNQLLFGYNLDGGGSSQLVTYGMNMIKSVDGNGKTERNVYDFLWVGKELPTKRDRDIETIHQLLGDLRKSHLDLFTDYTNSLPEISGSIILDSERIEPEYRGITTRNEDGTNATKFYITPTRLAFYDYKEARSFFTVQKEGIAFDNKFLARYYDVPERVTLEQLDNVQHSGKYLCSGINGVSTMHVVDYVKTNADGQNGFMTAIDIRRSTAPKWLHRTKVDGIWSEWFEVTT